MSEWIVAGGVAVQVSASVSALNQVPNHNSQLETNRLQVVQGESDTHIARQSLPTIIVVTGSDGIFTIIDRSQHVVARMGSRVNALGGMVTAEEHSDIRAGVGAHIEFLPGSKGIIEFGTDAKLWSGATVKIVDDVRNFLHSDPTV
jgi:hypothetical protein